MSYIGFLLWLLSGDGIWLCLWIFLVYLYNVFLLLMVFSEFKLGIAYHSAG